MTNSLSYRPYPCPSSTTQDRYLFSIPLLQIVPGGHHSPDPPAFTYGLFRAFHDFVLFPAHGNGLGTLFNLNFLFQD